MSKPFENDILANYQPGRSLKFYYQSMDGPSKKIYKGIYDAVIEMESTTTIYVKNIPRELDVADIYFKLRMDNPALFWLSNEVSTCKGNDFCQLSFSYIYSKESVEELSKKVKDASLKIGRIIAKYANDDYGVELAVHDLLAVKVSYGDTEKAESHNIIGPLINKKAVCEGISMVVQYLLNAFEIRCFSINGRLLDDSDIGHSWNVVILEDEAYHLDVTSDLTDRAGFANHSFFNVPDELMEKTHSWERQIACQGFKYNYMHVNGTDFKDLSEAKAFFRNDPSKLDHSEFRIMDHCELQEVLSVITRGHKGKYEILTIPGSDSFFVYKCSNKGLLKRLFNIFG